MSDLWLPAYRDIERLRLPEPLRRHVGFDARTELVRPATDDTVEGDYQELVIVQIGIQVRLRADPEVWKLALELAAKPDAPQGAPTMDGMRPVLTLPQDASATDRHFAEQAMDWGRQALMRSFHLRRNHPEQTRLWDNPDTQPLFQNLPLVDTDALDAFAWEVEFCRLVSQLTASKLFGQGPVGGRARMTRNWNRHVITELGENGLGPESMAFETSLPRSSIFRLQAEADQKLGKKRRR